MYKCLRDIIDNSVKDGNKDWRSGGRVTGRPGKALLLRSERPYGFNWRVVVGIKKRKELKMSMNYYECTIDKTQ